MQPGRILTVAQGGLKMPRGKTPRILALIESCRDILAEIQPATVRAVCYQLFVRQLIPSMKKTHTNGISAQLVYARVQGIIPWEWIVDETREAERHGGWSTPDSFIRSMIWGYRRDRWQLQPCRVEIWSEKGTVRGTLAPILREYGLTFRVHHGYSSATAVNDVAQETQQDPHPLIILYVGDWDPSGLHMSAFDLPRRLQEYGALCTMTRLAIDAEQARLSNLPTFSAESKRNDTRYEWFVSQHGTTCWELDALSPVDLRETVKYAVEQYIDWEAWNRCAATERAERRSLTEVLGRWKEVISGQATK